jgi:2-polyprenyl-3-methyl-5-hydroxy-6-metoxy-1,4-benzoquinol methylase|tara:strand:- start:934 stop:1854 length:921 start_codon:yes stop_codon:yes gene_type:complete
MELKSTRCAICNSFNNSHVLFPQRLPTQNLDASPYAPRRKRDFFHYRIVKCKTCGLLRSDPLVDQNDLKQLYFDSECTYTDENENIPLKKTYGSYFVNVLKKYNIEKTSFLDIGCSNGFILEKALEFGFKKIIGVEPSRDAIDQASSSIKPFIVNGMFDDKMFEKDSFDMITFFQTFDHIAEPNIFLQNCFNVLKEGGFILAINHNAKSFSAKIMGEKSPIIDIGHTYLYDLTTMKQIFKQNNFVVHNVFPIKNTVSIERLIQLLPIKSSTSEKIQQLARLLKINKCLLKLPLGNLGIVAQKLKTT